MNKHSPNTGEKCKHLNCLVYHADGVCHCDMTRYYSIYNPKETKPSQQEKILTFYPESGMICAECGIGSFAHLHRPGTLPKDFERIEEPPQQENMYDLLDWKSNYRDLSWSEYVAVIDGQPPKSSKSPHKSKSEDITSDVTKVGKIEKRLAALERRVRHLEDNR